MDTKRLRTHTFRAMNTAIELSLVCAGDTMENAIQLAQDWFEEVERVFSRFRSDSELSRMNRANGAPVLASTMFIDLLQLSEQYHKQTLGAFSPYVGRQLAEAGYNRSFEQLAGLQENNDSVADASGFPIRESVGLVQSPFQLDFGMRAITLDADVQLDFGGIAKGWAAEQLVRWLQTHYEMVTGLVNAGGDLQAWHHEAAAEEPRWLLRIDLPSADSGEAFHQRVNYGAMATSGSHRRRWKVGQETKHHLIDPFTGQPSDSGIVQCTVFGRNLIDCEVWAKTICIVGKERGIAMLQERAPCYEALLVDHAGNVTEHGAGWARTKMTEAGR
ncbi:ApbE family lipoprotein [Paenibacillus curdlanolyticus YK9]|uniref:FAD:protein FMN transferase n=1 Tax=Paenibacillus curdlanolyticus YK9 TaxID=717606 RepID=E0IE31_9BACL|nr:FAD:protein FMN transferase [Paenibacillus curdlanolyticus]EFM09385.1 ApbE family lipoprotein [Paenibacillus curdlanolyticus YK9]